MAKKKKTTDDRAFVNDAAPFVEEISKGAEEEVERIVSRARRTADTRLAQAKETAKAETEKALATARTQADIERRRIGSDLNLEMKKILLKARGELVEEVLAQAQARLERMRGTPEYRDLLKGLIVEGIHALGRHAVRVSISPADAAMAKELFPNDVFTDESEGGRVTITWASELDESAMGAVVRAADGTVLYDNTVAARSARLADELYLLVSREVFADEIGGGDDAPETEST